MHLADGTIHVELIFVYRIQLYLCGSECCARVVVTAEQRPFWKSWCVGDISIKSEVTRWSFYCTLIEHQHLTVSTCNLTIMRLSSTFLTLSFLAPLAPVSALWDGLPPEGTNPLALGFYTTPETLEPVELEVSGHVPRWLKGSLYRGAQAGWDAGNYTSRHWFDGFSRNHKFEIDGGKVSYRSRNASDEVADCE
jgi:hypothetical protein